MAMRRTLPLLALLLTAHLAAAETLKLKDSTVHEGQRVGTTTRGGGARLAHLDMPDGL